MVIPTNNNNKNNNNDRPISTYDNLNIMTANMNTIATTTNSRKPIMTKAPPAIVNTNATVTVNVSPPSSSKTNGAAHSTPFSDISFKFNENNIIPQQKEQQFQMNGNPNLNEIPTNTNNAAALVYATPYKTSVIKPVLTTVSPLLTAQQQHQQQQQQRHSPSIATTTETNALPSSPSLIDTVGTTTPAAAEATAINSDRFNGFNRPLSQHSQSELNDTSNSIAAVKAALNEAKSKFFGLNGYTPSQQQLQDPQQNYDDNYDDESLNQQLLLASDIQQHLQQIPNTHPSAPQKQQQQQVQKSQPKYQNIPENSAIFRNQNKADAVGSSPLPPDLPPKPVEYQSLQQTPTRSIQTSTPDHNRKMSISTNTSTYNQISLNDIDGAASRSQTVYMATTVPQNIKGNKIAGRHTPTRSSLRHSRMLVVNNKNYEDVQHPNPMGFRQPHLARWLLILQIIIGILLISISIWIFFLTPNTPVQDNPYWCGSVLVITGIVGLIVIRYQRFKRARTRDHCFTFLRINCYILSLLSMLMCCVALIFAAIHYSRLTAADTKCKSMNLLVEHGSCVCTFNSPPTVNTTEPLLNELSLDEDDTNQITDNSYSVEYRDLSCEEVTGPWTSILGLSFILNSLGFLISFAYIVLLTYCRRSSKRIYTTVRTSTF